MQVRQSWKNSGMSERNDNEREKNHRFYIKYVPLGQSIKCSILPNYQLIVQAVSRNPNN